MISKKFMLMAIFLVSLLAVSAVSANEINTTDEVAIDDGDLITAEVSEDISADSQEDVLNAKDAGTFTALQNKINAANNGSVITLENDYKYDEGFENTRIEISKPLTIDGNGHTIDALSKSRIFSVYSDDVTLKNIKFVNGNAQGAGGAIYSSGANFKVINSIFTDNIADANGGAIYSSGTNCRITNSMFENNKGWSGGAIGSEGTNCNIINSTFTNNIAVKTLTGNQIGNSWYPYYAGGYGGAIYSEGSNCNIADSIFTKNTADRKGGAVYVEGSNGNLSYSTFRDNVADESGGAIYWEADDGVISYCSYTKDFTQGNDLVCGEDVVVIEDSVKINVVDMSKYYGNSITFIATVTKDDAPVSGVNVKISAKGKTQTVSTNSKGQASVNLNLPVGTHEVTTEYDGVKATSNVNVKSTITAKDISGTYSNSKATATFLDTAGKALASKQVTFKIGTSSYAATTDSNGVASADIPLGVNTYTVTAVNPTTKEERQFKLTISKASSTTRLTAVQNGKSVTLTAALTPSAATGKVTFEINGKTKEASISNGKASATFTDLSPNTYPAKATYSGDANFKSSTATASVKVDKVYSVTNVKDTEGTYLNSKVSATFLNADGKVLANTEVTFKVAYKSGSRVFSKIYSATTDSKGVATASINQDVRTYNVTAINPTTKEEKQFKLTIRKATSIPSLTTVKNGRSVTLTVTISPGSVATGKATFLVNGKSYYSDVSGGKASVTVSDLAEGSYKASVTYSGDSSFTSAESSSISFDVKESNVLTVSGSSSGYYWDTKYMTITVKDSDGNPLANRDIAVNMEGFYFDDPDSDVFYLTTGSDGKAKLKLYCDYVPDEYGLCFSSKGCEDVYKTFTIKKEIPKFTAKAKTFKKSVKIKKYSVTVKNHNNKPLKNEKIVIKVKGVSYTAKTNSKGVATFKINKLNKKGTYTAKIFMYWTSYYKSVTKKVKITVK